MAIVFIEQQKRQQYLLFAFIFIVLVTLIVIWRGFLVQPPPKEAEVSVPAKPVLPEIKIDFNLFEDPFFENVQEFPTILPFEATGDFQLGRENPFIEIGE